MNYIDMHCDTLARAVRLGNISVKELENTMVDVKRLQQAGAKAQFFAMFLPQKQENGSWYSEEAITRQMQQMYQVYQNTLQSCSDRIAPVYCAQDFKKNVHDGKISAFLTVENGCVVDGKIQRIRQLFQMGVRLLTLTWNDANCLGFPHSNHPNIMQQGLTSFGKEAVAFMQELGILVDVSHLSDGGFYDVAELVKGPFVASHSNCRALSPATRNLTDDMIRCLAEHGGVAGLNFYPPFLNETPTDNVSRIERICDHAEHLIQIGGVECVGIGTDFDGIEGIFEIADCTEMEKLFFALQKRGIPESVLDKIAYQNVERVIDEVLR